MHDDISDRLLERYCAGDCTPEERAAVEAWAAEDPSHAETLALLVAGWRAAGAAAGPVERPDVGAAWEAVQARIGGTSRRRGLRLVPSIDQPRARWQRVVRPAAAIAAAAVLAVGGTMLSRHTDAGVADTARVDGRPLREIVTRRGQRAALNLPDGSRVVVGPESRLMIPRTYRTEAGPRDVFLRTGEAFFEVAHDKARPFRVHAANGIAEDLGTEFVVRAYPETKGMEAVVVSGEVALSAAGSRRDRSEPLLTLLPGDHGRLDSTSTATLTRGVSVASYAGWVNGDLVFDSTQMREVVRQLGRWYDVDVRLADSSLAARPLTVTFRGQSAAEALDHVALSLGARVEWHSRVAVLRAGGR